MNILRLLISLNTDIPKNKNSNDNIIDYEKKLEEIDNNIKSLELEKMILIEKINLYKNTSNNLE